MKLPSQIISVATSPKAKLSAPPRTPPAAAMTRSAPWGINCASVLSMAPPSKHGAEAQASDTADSRHDQPERAALAPSFRIHRLFPVHDFLRNVVRNLLELHVQRVKDALRFELDLFLRHGRCLRFRSSIRPCSREGRRLYGRSSATISISCTRKHAAPGSRRTTRGLYSRASTRGKARFRLTIGLLSSLYYWLMNVASFSSPLERLGGTNTGPFRYGFVPDERVATIAEPPNECGQ